MATSFIYWINFVLRQRTSALIAITGLAIRLIYQFQVVDTPIFPMMATDSEYFDAMARHLLNGQWGHPDAIFLNPFYPVFLAGIYSCSQADPMAVIIIQAILDGCNILLIAYIGSILTNQRAGIVAACLYAFYGIAIFYTGLLLAPSLAIFLSLAAIALLANYQLTGQIRWLPLSGFIFGMLILTRTNTVLFVPLLIIWVVGVEWTNSKVQKRLTACLFLMIGLALPLILNSMRNGYFFGTYHPFSVQGGINFYIGNNPDAEGIIMSPQGIPTLPVNQVKTSIKVAQSHTGHSYTPFEASNYWLRQGLLYIANHPLDGFALYGRKLALFWRKEEIALNINYDLSRELLPIMNRLPLISFGFVAPMALLGFVLALKRFHHTFLITSYTLTYMGSVVLFFVSDRYRLPIAPFLCLLAGLAVDTIISNVKLKAWPQYLPMIAVACLAAFGVNFDFPSFSIKDAGSHSIHYGNMGLGYKNKGDLAASRQALEKAVTLDPNNAVAFNNLGTVFLELEEFSAAQAAFEKAIALDTSSCEARYNLGKCYQEKEKFEKARIWYLEAIACTPQFANAHTNLAVVLLKANEIQAAENHLSKALASAPDLPEAHLALGRLELKKGRPLKALNHIKKAIHYQPGNTDSYVQLGLAYMQKGDVLEGQRAFETALQMAPKNTEALVGSGMALLQQSQIDAAIAQLKKARREKPDEPFALGLLAQAYFLKKDTAALETAFTQLRALDPAFADKLRMMLSGGD